MARSTLIPEAHLLLLRNNHVLLLQRQNTGYEDGNYSVIAGHIESNETARQGMAREAAEEAGLIVSPEDLVLCHVMHRKAEDQRVSFFFQTERWIGEPRNLEPQKCSDLSWFPVDSMPKNVIPYIQQAIEKTLRDETYSEYGWADGRDSPPNESPSGCRRSLTMINPPDRIHAPLQVSRWWL